MHIAIISPGPFSVPPVNGSSVEHDIDEVSKEISPNHRIIIYARTCTQYPRSSVERNRRYVRVPYTSSHTYLRRVIRDLRKRKVDVILVENRPAYVLVLRKYFPFIPIVVNMHSHVFAARKQIAPLKLKKVIKTADGFLTNSRYLRRVLIRRHRIPARKIHAVHLGVDTKPYQLQNAAVKKLRNRLHLRPRHRVLFFAGRLMREKGVHLLIRSFAKISAKDKQARLIIAGGAGYGSNRKNMYVKRLHELTEPIGNKVRFVNFIPTAEMPVWYQLANVVATPSVWGEPFCRVNLEAMASGKPVISTTRGGIPEVVSNGKEGFLVSPQEWAEKFPEIWKKLWGSAKLRQSMRRAALQRAAELNWRATAKGYVSVFAKKIRQKKRKPGDIRLSPVSLAK